MARPVGPAEIGIVVYPGAQLAAVHGLTDLFSLASRFAADHDPHACRPLHVSHWAAADDGVACTYRSGGTSPAQPTTLILPPTLGDLPDPATCETLSRWLLRQHRQGAALVTICSGVFLVAGTGLLDGRTVSTHRSCALLLRQDFPAIAVDTETQMIEHADIMTAGGFLAWVDVALVLIERLLGASVRAETARFVLAADGAARPSVGARPLRSHGDMAVRKAQELVHARDGHGISLAALVAASQLERRTFLRRFVNAMGVSPIEYCRAVRIARASELLEAGNMPLKEIADTLGYVDVSSFARAFRRVHGMPPGAYRQSHASAPALSRA